MADAGKELIDLTGDSDVTVSAISDDDDMHRAIALSLQSMPTSPPAIPDASTPEGDANAKLKQRTDSIEPAGGILGIDRKKQEEERLARLKRKREETVSPPRSKWDIDLSSTQSSSNRQNAADSLDGGLSSAKRTHAHQVNLPSHQSTPNLQYPQGVVKKTWAFGYEREDDIKLEEVLQPSHLQAAVLSSYQWDWDWLFAKLDTRRTKFVLVMQAKEEELKKQHQADFGEVSGVRLCFPSMKGSINCMHSKLMLLFYATHLRIVIPTANLVPYDWGEPFRDLRGGVMENTIFLIDLPTKGDGDTSVTNTSFFDSLLEFLKAMDLPQDVINKVHSFDFSESAQYGFIHSIGGSHYGDAWKGTGACGLGQLLHRFGLRTSKSIEIDFVTSSVGSLDDEFLRSLYLIARGDSGFSEYTLRTAKKIPPGIFQDLQGRVGNDYSYRWKQNFRIFYPSEDVVKYSNGGAPCGGTICFNSKWWNSPNFPRSLMRDCQSRRTGMLMHNKIWFTRYAEAVTMSSGQKAIGWAYVGSANLSVSAWGKLVRDRITKAPKLTCRNWECGVVIPITEEKSNPAGSSAEGQDSSCLGVFKNVVPVPMVVPGQIYQENRPNALKIRQTGRYAERYVLLAGEQIAGLDQSLEDLF